MDILAVDQIHLYVLGFLFLAGAFAGFVDSIVGGGGLISVPAFLLTNLPPAMALGTNKMSSVFAAATASLTFWRRGMVDTPLVQKLIPFTFLGSVCGTWLVISLPPLYVKPILLAILVGVMIFVLVKKDWGTVNRTSAVSKKALLILMGMAFGLGIYDGFIGPGVGTFLIMGFIFAGYDFVHGSGNAKVLNFTSNLASLLVFLIAGYVHFIYGLAAAAGQIIGAFIGARLAIQKGSGLVRGVFLVVTSCMLIKLAYDYIVYLFV